MQARDAITEATFADRLDRLERGVRRWRAAAMGAGLLGVIAIAGLAARVAPPEKVVTTSLEVVDAAGKVRARIALGKEGDPALELLDAAGVAQATLALGNFPRVEDRDRPQRLPGGRPVAASDAALTSILRLGNRDNEPAVELGAGERLRAIRLRDDFGDERIEFRVGPYVRPDLKLGATGDLVEATMRLKSPDERLALELGVEPISSSRPSDRRDLSRGPLVEEATPYLTMYGWCERPIFLLSNWSGDQPSLDLWEEGRGARRLLSIPGDAHGADTEEGSNERRSRSAPLGNDPR
jgi:hypothetical protein